MKFNYELLRTTSFSEECLFLAQLMASKGYYWSESNINKAILWVFHPVARQNAFQSLLYKSAWEQGVAPLGILQLEQALRLPWGGNVVVHLHWLNVITKVAKSEVEAYENVKKFELTLDRLKDQGKKLVWTVHNVLPHGSSWIKADVKAREIMVEKCDIVHALTQETIRETSPYFSIPQEKVLYCQHPTYENVYPDYVSRDESRFQLGVSQNEVLFLSFGAILPYKGYNHLMNAFDQLESKVLPFKPKLLIAGRPDDRDLSGQIQQWAKGRDNILLRLGRISEIELQYIFRSADAAVCPYTQTLNSGVAMLAATFGVPVIGPDRAAFKDNVPTSLSFLYPGNDYEAFFQILKDFCFKNAKVKYQFSKKCIEHLKPDVVSKSFFSLALDRLDLS